MNKPKKLYCISYKGNLVGIFQGFKELCTTAGLPYNTLKDKTDTQINFGNYQIDRLNFRELKEH